MSCEQGLGSLKLHAKKFLLGLKAEPIFSTTNKACPGLASIHGWDLTDETCSVSELVVGLDEQALV